MDWLNKRRLFCVILFLFVICLLQFLYARMNETRVGHSIFVQKDLNITMPFHLNSSDNIKFLLIDVAKFLKKAKQHARGIKTGDAITTAIRKMDSILQKYGTSFDESTRRKVFKSKSICQEYYVKTKHVYEIEKCSFGTPLHELVTVVMFYEGQNKTNLCDLISGISSYIDSINVLVGTFIPEEEIKRQENVYVSTFHKHATKGKILNSLISDVKTEYTLIARDVTEFNPDARVERLVREMERLNTDVVGGSIRDSTGYWNLSCYQRAFRNYTLVFQEGYDESLHDCVFCDHTDSPFLIKTSKILSLKFDDKITPMGVYEDFFMRLDKEIAVCPDSMFYVNSPKRSDIVTDWKVFGRKRNLYKMKFSSGFSIHFGCNYDYPCKKVKGYIRSPCCLQELADMNNYIMKVCEDSDSICEFHCGTLLGSLKMNKVIPWEMDGDIRIWYENFTAMGMTASQFRGKYEFERKQSPENSTDCCMENRGIYHVRTKNWRVEFGTFCSLDTYTLKAQNKIPTKAVHNGYAVNVPRNPSLAARNRYPQLYGHVQHVSEGGIYNVHRFSECKTKGRHDCIDNYRPDGNVQFNDPIP